MTTETHILPEAEAAAVLPRQTKEWLIVEALRHAAEPLPASEWAERLGCSVGYLYNIAYKHDCSENVRQPPQVRTSGTVRVSRALKYRPMDEGTVRVGVCYLRAAGMENATEVRITAEKGRIVIEMAEEVVEAGKGDKLPSEGLVERARGVLAGGL